MIKLGSHSVKKSPTVAIHITAKICLLAMNH